MDFGKKKRVFRAADSEADNAADSAADNAADYDVLLKRLYMNHVPHKTKIVIRPPVVSRLGSRKTGVLNFKYIYQTLRRDKRHMLKYVGCELGAKCSIDIDDNLIIVGRFSEAQVQSIIKQYIKIFVLCKSCKSVETLLLPKKIYCDTCQAQYSLPAM